VKHLRLERDWAFPSNDISNSRHLLKTLCMHGTHQRLWRGGELQAKGSENEFSLAVCLRLKRTVDSFYETMLFSVNFSVFRMSLLENIGSCIGEY
jgi:hypothetical protein